MTYQEIRNLGLKEISSAKDNFKIRTEEYLRENHLDQIVERVKDGRKGKLKVVSDITCTLNYDVRFYPVTKRGTVSQKADGFIAWGEELTETYKEATL